MEYKFTPHEKKTIELFRGGCSCAQATFAAFSDVTGIPEEEAMRLSSSFGGGMGGMREICGALSGIFMVCGYLYGYSVDTKDGGAGASKAKKEHYARIKRLAEDFKSEHETIVCRELLGSLAKNPPAAERTEEYYRVRPCVRFCATAARLMDQMIDELGLDGANANSAAAERPTNCKTDLAHESKKES